MKSSFPRRAVQIGVAALTFVSVSFAAMAAQGAYRAYYANDPVGRNVVIVLSQAPLETMVSRTGAITADIKIDPTNVLNEPKARFELDLDQVETGIKTRDEHMKSAAWLDTAKYPKAVFTLVKPLPPADLESKIISAAPGKHGDMEVEGELEFHGVKKLVKANVSVNMIAESAKTKERLPGELMHVRAQFLLNLADFGVKIPEPAQLKVANVQSVQIDVFASTGSKPSEE